MANTTVTKTEASSPLTPSSPLSSLGSPNSATSPLSPSSPADTKNGVTDLKDVINSAASANANSVKEGVAAKVEGKDGAPAKRRPTRRANTAERRATHNAVERMRRETLNGRFLTLASLLPPLAAIRRPSKAAIVSSSIATVNAARRHRVLAAQTLRALAREAEGLRREVNEWRARARVPQLDVPVRSDAHHAVLRAEVDDFELSPEDGVVLEEEGEDEDNEEGEHGGNEEKDGGEVVMSPVVERPSSQGQRRSPTAQGQMQMQGQEGMRRARSASVASAGMGAPFVPSHGHYTPPSSMQHPHQMMAMRQQSMPMPYPGQYQHQQQQQIPSSLQQQHAAQMQMRHFQGQVPSQHQAQQQGGNQSPFAYSPDSHAQAPPASPSNSSSSRSSGEHGPLTPPASAGHALSHAQAFGGMQSGMGGMQGGGMGAGKGYFEGGAGAGAAYDLGLGFEGEESLLFSGPNAPSALAPSYAANGGHNANGWVSANPAHPAFAFASAPTSMNPTQMQMPMQKGYDGHAQMYEQQMREIMNMGISHQMGNNAMQGMQMGAMQLASMQMTNSSGMAGAGQGGYLHQPQPMQGVRF